MVTIQHFAAVVGNGFIIRFEHQSLLGENDILIVVVVEIQKLDSDLFVSETPATIHTPTTTVSLRGQHNCFGLIFYSADRRMIRGEK